MRPAIQPDPFEQKFGQVFEALKHLDKDNVHLTKGKGTFTAESRGFFSNILSKFFHKDVRRSDLKELKLVFEEAVQDIDNTKDPQEKEVKRQKVEEAFKQVKKAFERYREGTSTEAVLKKNDLLEALSVAFTHPQEFCITRISAEPIHDVTSKKCSNVFSKQSQAIQKTSQNAILLVDYQHITQALEKLEGKELTRSELKSALENILQHEKAPMGKMIDILYGHLQKGTKAINQAVTQYAEYRYGSEQTVEAKKILKFFKSLHISVTTEFEGELYSYKETFGQDLRAKRSYNEAFERELTPATKELFFKNAKEFESTVQNALNDNTASVITSNAFSRLTVHSLEANDASKPFDITGKVMSGREENIQEAKKKKGPQGRFLFSVKEMFGFTSRDTLEHVEHITTDKLKANTADALVLRSIISLVNQEKTLLVVQRLAPDDIHHFYSTAKATVLSRKESCEALREELKNKGSKNGEEIKQLEELIDYFDEHPSKESTINIPGRIDSVNRAALYQDSGILMHNDRKIMMLRHVDGSLSIHTFIGATGVDRVTITAEPSSTAEERKSLGSMGFGFMNKTVGTWLPSRVSRILKQKPPQDITTQNALSSIKGSLEKGSFKEGGSTVVSIYFRKDYVTEPTLFNFVNKSRHTIQTRSWIKKIIQKILGKPIETKTRTIEVKMQLGNVIAIPTSFAALSILKKTVGDTVLKEQSLDELFDLFLEKTENLQEDPTDFDTCFALKLKEILTKRRDGIKLESDDQALLDKLKRAFSA
jgi:phosphatidylserine decarboxylase